MARYKVQMRHKNPVDGWVSVFDTQVVATSVIRALEAARSQVEVTQVVVLDDDQC